MENVGRNLTHEHYENYEDSSSIFGFVTFWVKCALTAWIVLINLILLSALACSSGLKKKSFHWFLFNLSITDLLVGLLVAPLSIYLGYIGYWELGSLTCQMWIIADILLCCLSLFSLLAINIDRLVFATKPLTYTMVMRKSICLAMIIFTWLAGAGIIVPLVFTDQIRSGNGQCYVFLAPTYALGSSIVSFFLPAVLVIIVNICIVVVVSRKIKTKRRSSIRLDDTSGSRPTLETQNSVVMATMVESREKASRDSNSRLKNSALAISVANALYLLMWFPFFLLNVLIILNLYTDIPAFAFEFCYWLGYANSGVNPLIWLIYPEIRAALKEICCCCCLGKRRSGSIPDDNYSYRKNEMYSNTRRSM